MFTQKPETLPAEECVSPQSVSVRLDDCLELQQELKQSVSQETEAQTGRRPGFGINHFVKTPDGFLYTFGVFLRQIRGCVLRLFQPRPWKTTEGLPSFPHS